MTLTTRAYVCDLGWIFHIKRDLLLQQALLMRFGQMICADDGVRLT